MPATAPASDVVNDPAKIPRRTKRRRFLRRKEVRRPGDRSLDRALAVGQVRAARGPEAASFDVGEDRAQGERRSPGRDQLDRQRQPVEPPADLRHDDLVGRADAGADRLGAQPEEGRPVARGIELGHRHPPFAPDPEGTRLVARTWIPGAADAIRGMAPAADTTCSQLSITRRIRRSASARPSAASAASPGRTATPAAAAIAAGTAVGSRTEASSTRKTPSGKSPSMVRATSTARRVLPVPPGPSSVTIRELPRASATAAISRCRPTNAVTSAGRFVGVMAEVRRGRASGASPSTSTWNTSTAAARSFRRCGPRGRSRRPGGRSPTAPATSAEQRVWLPQASAWRRAQRKSGEPK